MNGISGYLAIGLALALAAGAACAHSAESGAVSADRDGNDYGDGRHGKATPVVGSGWDPATPGTEFGSTGIGADGRMIGPRAAITHPDDLRLRLDPAAPRGYSYGPSVADRSRQSHAEELDQ